MHGWADHRPGWSMRACKSYPLEHAAVPRLRRVHCTTVGCVGSTKPLFFIFHTFFHLLLNTSSLGSKNDFVVRKKESNHSILN
jgi:hypothetical protein